MCPRSKRDDPIPFKLDGTWNANLDPTDETGAPTDACTVEPIAAHARSMQVRQALTETEEVILSVGGRSWGPMFVECGESEGNVEI